LLNWLNFDQSKNTININDLCNLRQNINDLRHFLKIVLRKIGYLWKKFKKNLEKMFFYRKSYCHAEKKMLRRETG